MGGIRASIRECYDRAYQLKTIESVEYCFVIDFLASDIDAQAAKNSGFPPDDFDRIELVNTRLNQAFDLLKIDAAARGDYTARWSGLAFHGLRTLRGFK
jgi:hypothetical protein